MLTAEDSSAIVVSSGEVAADGVAAVVLSSMAATVSSGSVSDSAAVVSGSADVSSDGSLEAVDVNCGCVASVNSSV